MIQDDPSLRVHWELLDGPKGRDPYRIVVDGSGRIPERARVLDGSLPTIVATSRASRRTYPAPVERIVAGATRVDLGEAFRALAAKGLRRLFVEGGAELLASVVRGRLFDRWTVYYAPVAVGGPTAPSILAGPDVANLADAVPVNLTGVERLGEGFVATYVPGPAPSPASPTARR